MRQEHNRGQERASPHAHRHRHRLHAAPLLGRARRLGQAPVRRRAALRRAAHVEDQPAARRAAAGRHRRHALRRGHRPRRAVPACGRDRQRVARGWPLDPDHQPSGRALPLGDEAMAGRHRRCATTTCTAPTTRSAAASSSTSSSSSTTARSPSARRSRTAWWPPRRPTRAADSCEPRTRAAPPRLGRGVTAAFGMIRGLDRHADLAPSRGAGSPPAEAGVPPARLHSPCGEGVITVRRQLAGRIRSPSSDGRGSSYLARPRRRGRSGHRPAPLPAGRRARAPGQRLGPLGAHRGPHGPHADRVLLSAVVPLRGRGDRERARRGRARCWSPTTPARCRPTRP